MKTLNDLLAVTGNGKAILYEVVKLGLKNPLLYKSFYPGTLCIAIDIHGKGDSPQNINEITFRLKARIARLFDCKTIIIHHPFISEDDKIQIAKKSVALPVQEMSELIRIFGNPEEYRIKTLDEDKFYKRKLELYESIISSSSQQQEKINNSTGVTPELYNLSLLDKKDIKHQKNNTKPGF